MIEVALPLDSINAACKEDKDRKVGHIRNLHKWFAPMPLPAWRAILFAALVDDPGDDRERQRLFRILESLLPWDAMHDAAILERARTEIRRCLGNELPAVVDPFCGGGSTLVEAQRLGLPAVGSDLNPVPVLITRLLTQVPQLAAGKHPINPDDANTELTVWPDLEGFKADVRYYARWIRNRAISRIGKLFPPGPDGNEVFAWRWARTVLSPDPRYADKHTPLVSDWRLESGKKASKWIEPEADASNGQLRFKVQTGPGPVPDPTTGRTAGRCLFSESPIPLDYVRQQGQEGRLGLLLLCTATKKGKDRNYFVADDIQLAAAEGATPEWRPEIDLVGKATVNVGGYGVRQQWQLYTNRQLVVLDTFASLVGELRAELLESVDGQDEYIQSLVMFLGLCVGKMAQANSSLVRWLVRPGIVPKATPAFDRQAIPMLWDFVETNPFGGSVGDWLITVNSSLGALSVPDSQASPARVTQLDARALGRHVEGGCLIATDPPYFNNINYADLSDFFYVWLRRALRESDPGLFATMATPKSRELIANPARHGGSKQDADLYFRAGFSEVFGQARELSHPSLPVIVIYAYKQQESDEAGTASTGWDAMLDGLLSAGLGVVGTWPIYGSRLAKMIGVGANALASYTVLVCRPRDPAAPIATRREFVDALAGELPQALHDLTSASVAPVALAQAAIGPGMAIFSRYSKVLQPDGELTVRQALQLINQALSDYLSGLEGDLDADTQFCTAWFEQFGFAEGGYGDAELLATSKAISVQGLADAGVLFSRAGKVRLRQPSEYSQAWDPRSDVRAPIWECAHQLIRALDGEGEAAASELMRAMGPGRSEESRSLAYRLYGICERKGWTEPAISYNALVASWPSIMERAAALDPGQTSMEL